MLTSEDLKSPSKITPNIYLGSLYTAASLIKYNPLNIEVILDVSGETTYLVPEGIEYHCVPFPDGAEPSKEVLHKCIKIIDAAHYNRKPILIHCAAGISRSPSIVAMYIYRSWIDKKFVPTLEAAIDHIRLTRDFIHPSSRVLTGVKKYLHIFPYDGSFNEER